MSFEISIFRMLLFLMPNSPRLEELYLGLQVFWVIIQDDRIVPPEQCSFHEVRVDRVHWKFEANFDYRRFGRVPVLVSKKGALGPLSPRLYLLESSERVEKLGADCDQILRNVCPDKRVMSGWTVLMRWGTTAHNASDKYPFVLATSDETAGWKIEFVLTLATTALSRIDYPCLSSNLFATNFRNKDCVPRTTRVGLLRLDAMIIVRCVCHCFDGMDLPGNGYSLRRGSIKLAFFGGGGCCSRD
ncbi:hypothetical protein Tco_0598474 [Tanacetum coccineum]